jgi:hypothetical protein
MTYFGIFVFKNEHNYLKTNQYYKSNIHMIEDFIFKISIYLFFIFYVIFFIIKIANYHNNFYNFYNFKFHNCFLIKTIKRFPNLRKIIVVYFLTPMIKFNYVITTFLIYSLYQLCNDEIYNLSIIKKNPQSHNIHHIFTTRIKYPIVHQQSNKKKRLDVLKNIEELNNNSDKLKNLICQKKENSIVTEENINDFLLPNKKNENINDIEENIDSCLLEKVNNINRNDENVIVVAKEDIDDYLLNVNENIKNINVQNGIIAEKDIDEYLLKRNEINNINEDINEFVEEKVINEAFETIPIEEIEFGDYINNLIIKKEEEKDNEKIIIKNENKVEIPKIIIIGKKKSS